jgi:hypothetical protein
MNSMHLQGCPTRRGPWASALVILTTLSLLACTPQYDWREVRNEAPAWIATFPGKPVEVTRQVVLPAIKGPVTLTLRSSRVNDTMFAVGWVSVQPLDPKALGQKQPMREIQQALEVAMLKNIQADEMQIKRQTDISVPGSGELKARQINAQGRLQTGQNQAPTEAALWMRTLTIEKPLSIVLEVIVVGPKANVAEEVAMQFIDSLRLP